MQVHEATIADISDMHRIRLTVQENKLSDPGAVTPADYEDFIRTRGKGWVCRMDGCIRGFGFVNAGDGNVWALFVEPGYDKLGIGRRLHDTMLEWAFTRDRTALWLTTDPGTRAEGFYRKMGWRETNRMPCGQIRYELNRAR
jgi:GNAT superfamily N-acetyltransferase